MPLTEPQLRDIIERHYTEASGGVVAKPASRLIRGEATEVDFYIMKVDLVASTAQLSRMQNRSFHSWQRLVASSMRNVKHRQWNTLPNTRGYVLSMKRGIRTHVQCLKRTEFRSSHAVVVAISLKTKWLAAKT